MKNYIHKVFWAILMGALLMPTGSHAMDKKRTFDEICDEGDIVDKNMKKLCAPKLQEKDWMEIFGLLGRNEVNQVIEEYFDIIYNSGQMERLLVLALHFKCDEIIQKARSYSGAFFAKILCDDNDGVKDMVEKKYENVNAHHVHMALLLRNKDLLTFFLNNITQQELKNYDFNGDGFIEYLIELTHRNDDEEIENYVNDDEEIDNYVNNDEKIENYVQLFIKHGCKVGYNELRMVIEGDISGPIADFLLDAIVDVNEKPTNDTKSLLWYCVRKQLCDWIEKLLHKGAIVTKQDIIENYYLGFGLGVCRKTLYL